MKTTVWFEKNPPKAETEFQNRVFLQRQRGAKGLRAFAQSRLSVGLGAFSENLFFKDFFNKRWDFFLKRMCFRFQFLVDVNFLALPDKINPSNLARGYMGIVFWIRPITGQANCPILDVVPIFAMLTRPRFCPVCRTGKQHKIFWVKFSPGGGIVTIDYEKRIFCGGMCPPHSKNKTSVRTYARKGWRDEIIKDAIDWLEAVMGA